MNSYADDMVVEINDNSMKALNDMATEQDKLEDDVRQQEASLKLTKKSLYNVKQKSLPELMKSLGMADFTTTSGLRIKLTEEMSASLKGKYKEPALDWLEKSGNGSIIQNDIVAAFKKGDEDKAQALVDELANRGFVVSYDQNIHTGTFKSLIKELLENGEEVPIEELGIITWEQTNVTRVTPA